MKLTDLKNLDKKSKIELAAVGVLLVVLIVSFSGAVKKVFSKVKPVQAPLTQEAKKALDLVKEIKAKGASAENTYAKQSKEAIEKEKDMKWGRDPFYEQGTGAAPSDVLALQGITWQGQNSRAIISNQIVAVGDRIGQNTVVEIQRNYVVLNDGTENFTLRLE